ncbi:MAG: isochorismatase family protein [Planctomycetota bacterium]|nr:isochorismatase family protein [Planctomycetota bacterium]
MHLRSDLTRATTVALCGLLVSSLSAAKPDVLSLTTRSRTETTKGSGRFHATTKQASWNAKQTAIVVCDMWDLHHCLNATLRGGEMAPRMNQVLKTAREMGVTIIHAPSSCTAAYQDHPARRNALKTPRSENLPKEIAKWCHRIPSEEQGKYPIDQSDGGEDDDPVEHAAWAKKLQDMGRNPRAPWKKQTDLLDIADNDFVSDNGEEIWSVMEQRGISNVILLGVHTNMCVLGRPFGLRQMAKNGKNVVLMRDMTDTMYNPKRAPFVSHFTGTDLIVDHIEQWVCPTITSDQIIGGKPFTFKNDKRPHLVIVMAEREYRTNESLPKFAAEQLGQEFKVSLVHANDKERNDLPSIEVLQDADLALISVRRRVLPAAQMKILRAFVDSGKPILGIRTANHAFVLRGQQPPKGTIAWQDWDADIFGGSYTNHHGNGPKTKVVMAKGAGSHPILASVNVDKLVGNGSLYVVNPLAKGTHPLIIGSIPDKPAEPLAWTFERSDGGKSFYTSLGHIQDFENPEFIRFLKNAILWGAELKTGG